jgi:hypothetical protein
LFPGLRPRAPIFAPLTARLRSASCRPSTITLAKGIGDVIMLQGPRAEFRLRVGDYRVIFLPAGEHSMEVLHVKHRSQAYR